MTVYLGTAKFQLGRLVITPGALRALGTDDVVGAVARHLRGDWGNVDKHDWQLNDEAREFGGRILSEYFSQDHVKFWLITECDRSVTTILLPEEY